MEVPMFLARRAAIDLRPLWRMPVIALLAASPTLAETIFGDGFEVGSVCYWSSSAPSFPCAPHQSCSDAASPPGTFWSCFELPFSDPPQPAAASGEWLPPGVDAADVYVLLDRSGDMLGEAASLRTNLSTVRSNVTCPPNGTGTPGSCYPDLWMGAGTIHYAGTSPSFQNHLDLQPNPDFSVIPITEPTGCCSETWLLSTWAAITGMGTATSGCTAGTFADRTSCDGSPAQLAGYVPFGYPCFRSGAVSLIVLPGAEDPGSTLVCPSTGILTSTAVAAGVRIVGLLGSGATAAATNLLAGLATGTGAVDPANGNAPLVFPGADAQAASGVETALLTARSLFKHLSVAAQIVDDPNDAVDVVTEFVDHLEALDGGAPGCASGLAREDSDLDGFFDTFLDVPYGATLCFSIVAHQNANVPGTTTTQNFLGSLDLTVNDTAPPAASLPLLFLVPPG
jgi:hypothetical protein